MILRSHLRSSCNNNNNNNNSRRRMGSRNNVGASAAGGRSGSGVSVSDDMMDVDDDPVPLADNNINPPSSSSASSSSNNHGSIQQVVAAAVTRGINNNEQQQQQQQPVVNDDDDPEAVKVIDTLDNVLGCLNKNIHTNIIYFPRSPTTSQLDEVDANRLVDAIRSNTSLTNLTIEESRMSNLYAIQKVIQALLEHTNFQRLTFYDNRLGDEGVATIVNVLHQYSTTSRIMNNPMIQQQQQQQLRPNPQPTATTSNLQALCLCGNQIGDRGAYWLAQGLISYKFIYELDLSSNEISEHGATYLASMLSKSQLTAFILNGNQIGFLGAKAIAEATNQNQRLDVLGLCGNDIGDDGAICVAHVAKTHSRLKAILLEDNFLGERGIIAVADAYRNNPRLGIMEVSWNFVSPIAIQVVSQSMNEIIYLYLDHCEIGDTHMSILGTGLAYNRSIKDLFLEGNHIGYDGVESLSRSLSTNTFLGGVFLDGNMITRQGSYLLRDVLQHTNMTLKRVQIHDDYHDIQREIDVYLDMNGTGRDRVLKERDFPIGLWSNFLGHKNVTKDADLVYLFLKERPDLFQRYSSSSSSAAATTTATTATTTATTYSKKRRMKRKAIR